jgi:hypothetical protein
MASPFQPAFPDNLMGRPGFREQPVSQPGFQEFPMLYGGDAGQPGFQENGNMAGIPISQHGGNASQSGLPDYLQPITGGFDLGLSGKDMKGVDPFLRAALGLQTGLHEQLMGSIQNYGQGALQNLEQGFTNRFGSSMASLEQRGLGGSTLVSNMQLGLERERQLARGSLFDQLLGRRMDVMQSTSKGIGDILAAISQTEEQQKARRAQEEQQNQIRVK